MDDKLQVSYALSKQVPDMERGFSISTNYGDIVVDGEEGREIIEAVRKMLERKYAESK